MKPLLICLLLFMTSFGKAQCDSISITLIGSNPTCNNFSDGLIDINVDGTNGSFFLYWINENGDTLGVPYGGQSIDNWPSGTFIIFVVDDSGCVAQDTITLINPDPITIDYSNSLLYCMDSDTGWISIDSVYGAQGDPAQIGYFWNPNPAGVGGIGANVQTGIGGGTYGLTIADAFGCSNVFSLLVDSPPLLEFDTLGFIPCSDITQANLFAAATGGTPDYTFYWYDLSDMTYIVPWGGVSPGAYEIQIVDAYGCSITDTIYASCLDLQDEIVSFNLYPNPTTGSFIIESNSPETIAFTIRNTLGEVIYQGNTEGFVTEVNLNFVGIAFVQVGDGPLQRIVFTE